MAVQAGTAETPPIIEIESNEAQDLLLQEAGFTKEDLLDGSIRIEEQLRLGDDDNDPPDPTYLAVSIDSPVNGAAFYGSASQGVTITASGTVDFHGYIVQSVEVKIGASAYAPVTLSNANTWTRTSGKITTSGPVSIFARVTGRRIGNSQTVTRTVSRTITVNITDDIPPTVTITQPPNGFQVSGVNGKFSVELKGTAADNASGIKQVEYCLDGSNWIVVPTSTPTNWQTNVKLNFKLNSQTISVRAKDGAGRYSAVSQRTVVTVDNTAPKLEITLPKDGVDLPGSDAAGAILPRLEGRASDVHSGVQRVEWALNPMQGTQFTPVTKDTNGWKWSVKNIVIPGPAGPNKIKVRCYDVAGNWVEQEIKVAVSLQYPPKDPTVQEYLSSLIDFIVRRVKVTNVTPNRPLQVADLTARFIQPFHRLLEADAALSARQTRQVRICIEVLRQYWAKVLFGFTGDPRIPEIVAKLQAAEANYRQSAYEAILNRIGTSFEELRTARLASPQARRALAERLGIELPQRTVGLTPEPSRLQRLLLQPGQFTEADLETLFGLVDTNRDPLERREATPELLDWQLQTLEEAWGEQDEAAAVPIIDPDLISEADLHPRPNPAYDLWQNRQNWINSQLAALKGQLKAQADPLVGFDLVVGDVLGPIDDLTALEAQRLAGTDIEPRLAQMQLTLPAFVRLMQLRKLLAARVGLAASEVDDVASILAQVQKRRSFADWRGEEQSAQLILGPAFFRIPAAGRAAVLPGVAPQWRVSTESRRAWLDTLQARIDQQTTLKYALLSAVDGAEEEALPLLRDALVEAIAGIESRPDQAEALTQQLLIDVKTGGFQKITRVEQAIQTLQELLIALRMENVAAWSRDATKEDLQDFDEELRWMGSYANWLSAMQVFLFPENLLLPTLRPVPAQLPSTPEKDEQTPAFQRLLKDLRVNSKLTPERARTLAGEYLSRLKSDYGSRGFSLLSLPPQITEQYTQSQLLSLAIHSGMLITAATLGSNSPTAQLQNIPAYLKEVFYFVPVVLALHLQKSGQYLAALDWFRVVYAYDLPVSQRKIYAGLNLEHDATPDPALVYQRNVFWLKDSLNPHDIVGRSYANPASARYDAYTRFVVMSLVRCLLDFADAEFTHDTNESLPRARSLYQQALELLNLPEMNPPAVVGLSPNPVVASLKLRAEVNLVKLRNGRNITGLKRQLEQVVPAGQAAGSLSLAAWSGPFGTTSAQVLQPTPYRYSALIDRAKQLVTIAQQVENAYLSALEKRDGEEYNLLKANQDLGLAQANVQLQNLRVTEATDSLVLADLQRQRAEFQVETFQGFLDAGMNTWERKLLDDYRDSLVARNLVAGLDAALSVAQMFANAAGDGFLGTGIGGHWGFVSAAVALAAGKAAATIKANNIDANIQRHSLHASIENRRQEWTLQLGLAQKDVAISDQQKQLARDQQNIVGQELLIAQMQTANAQATVEFLARKFTNVELYEWMSGVLQEVYAYLLQQTTAVARLAQDQLAFERQEAAPLFIQNDYWEPPTEGGAFGALSEPDRRGLTGSARLLRDIYQLDQFAFETNKRKLQLSKTFSLARLAPLEFQRFRETGTLSFATPMRLFDQDFPGHYLRLIKQVRTSVAALIPPNQGIRATLSTPGVSRVVIGGDVFQSVTVRRDPESVALTSPSNATGLFEMEAQSDLLLPFEFMGVDTFWSLEMPKAANPFDYRTIADVLFTIEYTALSSLDYRRQVIQQLDRTVVADRAFSFRQQFADQWYDLHNPDQTATPMAVSFSTRREDFPPNIEQLATAQVALYFVPADGKTLKEFRARLRFTEQGTQTAIGGEAMATPDGIISTRLGNAPSWTPMINRSPFGLWELALPDAAEIRGLFANEEISDIVFVLTTSGRTPAWPL